MAEQTQPRYEKNNAILWTDMIEFKCDNFANSIIIHAHYNQIGSFHHLAKITPRWSVLTKRFFAKHS